MWIEADTNLPSGESLVRQILFGKQFTRAEFGLETRTLWMPDVFGYSAALPQIMLKCGLDSIMTTKISWNQFNRFPCDTFHWRGIDGRQVLAHFITTPELTSRSYSYNGEMTPFTVKGIWDQYKQKEINDELLLCFGAGDGGGGPTKEALEAASAMKAIPGLPQVELGRAEDYFERMHKRLVDKELPVWDGELYLEYHRGTYTSQAANKRANRKSEILYHDAEFYGALADTLTGQHRYPAAELREGWEKILLNQFHDILPGSSIRQVYQDSQQDYCHISEIGERAVRQAKKALFDRIPTKSPSVVVLNSLGWPRDALVQVRWTEGWENKTIANVQGEPCTSQVVEENGAKKVLFQTHDLPALGYRVYPVIAAPLHAASEPMVITPKTLETKSYRIALNERGQMTSLFDKINQRQVLAPGARANVLQAFDDKPMAFDAWDIDIFYQEKMREVDDLIEAVVEETGPLRGVLRLRWRFRDSEISQRITLYRDSPRIDFRTWIDWHESQQLLKTAFPVSIRSTRATYDIQFGNVERPTHWNTSWDLARFEVVAHKWADLSEGDYGVSLLNDCKYGYDVKNNVIRLTLLKSAVRPDDFADRGQHEFTYALLPHKGDWREGKTIEQAYALNYPAHASFITAPQAGDLPAEYAFASVDTEGVIVETIKEAEEGRAWVVRVYESTQCRHGAAKMTIGQPIRKAVECNLLEEDEQPAPFAGRDLTFSIAPYEIKTFKIWF
jgi:alpha-mannosidase